MLYVIIKQFRDKSGIRFPGDTIELTSSRAAVLRESGLIGKEYVPPEQKPDTKPTETALKETKPQRKASKKHS